MLSFYEILGVKKSTSKEDIKKAYKVLAREYHPDKNPGNEDANNKFKDITEAYTTLSDDDARLKYDNRMSFSFGFNRYKDAFGESTTATNFQKPVKKEIPKGSNLRVNIDLTIEDMHTGCEKTIKINKWNICNYCDGSGAKTHRKCSLCNGEGQVKKISAISIIAGRTVTVETCGRCYGNRLEIESPCTNCQGNGIIKEFEHIIAKIPKLASKDEPVTISGKGDAGKNGGGCGDLIIHINELPHHRYTREYNDLYLTLDVNISDLVLGNVFNIETLHGFINMKIKAGTEVGKIFKIKGQGLDKNDLFIKLNLIIPKNLEDDEKILYENLKNVEKKFTFTL